MKILEKGFIRKERKTHLVMMERNVMTAVTHPNVVRLYFTFQDPQHLYFVMDFCRGGDLLGAIRHFRDATPQALEASAPPPAVRGAGTTLPCRGMPLHVAQFYLAQLVLALEYLHCRLRVVHRDLKPENLLLTADGHLKVCDFGTARDEKATDAKQDAFLGTAEYVSPEVLNDRGSHAPADLWALGCILYQCLAGRPPFQAGTEYLTFQAIQAYTRDPTQGVLAFPEDMPPQAVDLVKALTRAEPCARLGAGSDTSPATAQRHADLTAGRILPLGMEPLSDEEEEEEGGGGEQAPAPVPPSNPPPPMTTYADLKAHPFFSGVQWDALLAAAKVSAASLLPKGSAGAAVPEEVVAAAAGVRPPFVPSSTPLPPPVDATHLSWENVGEVLALSQAGKTEEATSLLARLREDYVPSTPSKPRGQGRGGGAGAEAAARGDTPTGPSPLRVVAAGAAQVPPGTPARQEGDSVVKGGPSSKRTGGGSGMPPSTASDRAGPSFRLASLRKALGLGVDGRGVTPPPSPSAAVAGSGGAVEPPPTPMAATPAVAMNPSPQPAASASAGASEGGEGGADALVCLPALKPEFYADQYWAPLLAAHLQPGEGVIMWGSVGKKRGVLGRELPRDLVLTNGPQILYFDANKQVLKGRVTWSPALAPTALDREWFVLREPSHALTVRVRDRRSRAQAWVGVLSDMLALQRDPVLLAALRAKAAMG